MSTTAGPPRAPATFQFHGREIPRVIGFVSARRILCPDHHVVNEPARFLEDGTLFCGHRSSAGQLQCGALIYILAIPGRGGRRRLWAADCTREELAEIERLELDADGIVEYFGGDFLRRGNP